MRIEALRTKLGQTFKLGKISILVGANNAGKSQTLKDIKDRMVNGKNSRFVILDEIVFNKPQNSDEIIAGLQKNVSKNISNTVVSGITNTLLGQDQFEFGEGWIESNFQKDNSYDFTLGNLSKFRVAHIDSSTRLNLVKRTDAFNPNEGRASNLIQALLVNKEVEEILQKAFRDAFTMDIKLDWSEFVKLSLLIDSKLPAIPEDPQKAYPVTKNITRIDSEGDGYKSFAGIILALLLSKDRIILLDEPEAFLHPSQSRVLGKWIADNSDKLTGQLFIATHSSNFLTGILSSTSNVDIYRLNRDKNSTAFNLIPADATKNLTKSPLLSSQRVLEAIFHKGVVVGESDADRAVYGSVAAIEFNKQDVLFIHAHNKQTLKDVAKLLIDSKIPVKVVSDIDLLNTEQDLINLIEALAGKTPDPQILKTRGLIAKSINNEDDPTTLKRVHAAIEEFSTQLEKGEHTLTGAKGAYNRIAKEFSKWREVKSKGIEGFDEKVKPRVRDFINSLKRFGIYVVPVGELEGWIDVGTKKKNKWIVPALEVIYSKKSPEALKQFVKEIVGGF